MLKLKPNRKIHIAERTIENKKITEITHTTAALAMKHKLRDSNAITNGASFVLFMPFLSEGAIINREKKVFAG